MDAVVSTVDNDDWCDWIYPISSIFNAGHHPPSVFVHIRRIRLHVTGLKYDFIRKIVTNKNIHFWLEIENFLK